MDVTVCARSIGGITAVESPEYPPSPTGDAGGSIKYQTGQLEKTEQEQGKLQVPAHPMTTPTPARKLYATELPDESAIRGQFMISPFEGIFHLANENIARKLPRKGSPSNVSHRCHSHG